mmetsp:Transcript_76620/g.126351  ORF Transcript_76620/g.126351 Transcript_76620/m.126351 type:complete len:227 (+) Transcript_76620:70-750(+)
MELRQHPQPMLRFWRRNLESSRIILLVFVILLIVIFIIFIFASPHLGGSPEAQTMLFPFCPRGFRHLQDGFGHLCHEFLLLGGEGQGHQATHGILQERHLRLTRELHLVAVQGLVNQATILWDRVANGVGLASLGVAQPPLAPEVVALLIRHLKVKNRIRRQLCLHDNLIAFGAHQMPGHLHIGSLGLLAIAILIQDEEGCEAASVLFGIIQDPLGALGELFFGHL